MRRMMMAGLAAAAVFCAVLPQGQAADGAAMTTVEMRGLSETYTKSAEPPVEDVSEDAVPRLFPLLRVVDYPGALRADGRVIAWVSHPEISVVGDDYPVLARALRNWSNAQRQQSNEATAYLGAAAREWMPSSPYYSYTVVERWGRTDERIVSFALRNEEYSGGAHPLHRIVTENIDVETGEQVSIDEIVTGRDILMLALADAFRTQYPQREEDLFLHDIDKTLEDYHDGSDWQEHIIWMLDANHDLHVFYNPYDIASYAEGSFEVIVRRDVYPEVFWMDDVE